MEHFYIFFILLKYYVIYFDNIQSPLLPLNLSSPPLNFMSSITLWLIYWVQFVLLGNGKLTDYPSETSTVNTSLVRVGTCGSFPICAQILADVIFYRSSVNNLSCWAHEWRAPVRYRRPYPTSSCHNFSIPLFFPMSPEPWGKVDEHSTDTLWTVTSCEFLS